MILNNSKNHIKFLAETIALQFESHITPLHEIVKQENLMLFYDDYEKETFDGMTIFHNNNFSIHINSAQGNKTDNGKGRFTLAHELGHYFIDSHRLGLKNGLLRPHPSNTNKKQFVKIEREADFFASCLLMPEEKFKKDVFKKKFNIELIDFLREKYNVSRTACAFRFSEIGNHPIMIIYAENNIVKWTKYSDDFPFKYLNNINNIVPLEMVMSDYFKNISDEIFKTVEIWAIDCFKYVKDYDIQRKFKEHCITYQNKALSIIWED